jgi:hypothetical protein
MSNKRKTTTDRRKRKAVGIVFHNRERGVHIVDTKVNRWERDASTIEYAFDHVAHCDTHEHTLEGLGHDDLMAVEMMLVEYDPATIRDNDEDGAPTKVFPNVVAYLAEFGITVDDTIPVIGPDGGGLA